MHPLPGASIVERGIFDPKQANETAIFGAWIGLVAIAYLTLAAKHRSGPRQWVLLILGLVMPAYALRYVLFGTRWGSNSSFAMVNLAFTALCPARILLPCPDNDPVQCQLSYPKTSQGSTFHAQPQASLGSSPHNSVSMSSLQPVLYILDTAYANQNATLNGMCTIASSCQSTVYYPAFSQPNARRDWKAATAANHTTVMNKPGMSDRTDLHFPVLVPLWQIYVRERPLPIYLHTTFMTVAALLWPLQLWKGFRQHNLALHRRLGYLALGATACGSLAAAPYALSYLLSAQMPETITGLGYLGMYSCAAYFLVAGIQAAHKLQIEQHQMNMVRLVGLSWGVSPLGRILTVTPPIIWFTGPWNNAAVVCLSWPLGIWIAKKYLLVDTVSTEKLQTS